MVTLLLANIHEKIMLDNEDVERVSKYNWNWKGQSSDVLSTEINGKVTSMGRFLLGYDGLLQVDHKDRNNLNYQKGNLRVANAQQQRANSGPMGLNTYKGVSWFKTRKCWRATIKVNGIQKHLGYFDSEENAAKAYDKAAKQYFGEYARLNFPD
jgi:hypothetical protein